MTETQRSRTARPAARHPGVFSKHALSSFPVFARALAVSLLVAAWWQWSAAPALAQETRDSLTGEKAAADAKKREIMEGWNLHWDPFSFQVESSFHVEFTDNAFNASVNRKSDEILQPEVKLNSYWPITDLNALTLSLGVNYQYYVNNTQINPDIPLISPGSELAFLLWVKDFRFRFHEAFSYQESLYYGLGYSPQTGQFINLNNIGTFGRIDNLAGLDVDWDLSDVVLSLNYNHENFISKLGVLDYLTRSSELFSASAEYILGPRWRAGVETKASWNEYETGQLPSHWRARVGPYMDRGLGDYIKVRVGGGYDDVLTPRDHGLATDSTPYYVYARASHILNDWLTYSISVAHENQLGWNTVNAGVTYVVFSTAIRLIAKVDLTAALYACWGKESGPNYTGYAWTENYNCVEPSLTAVYHLAERWTADLRYDYIDKGSSVPHYDFSRNRLTLGVTYQY